MKIKKRSILALSCFLLLALSACSIKKTADISITGAATATGIDENLMPINKTNGFPKGTQKVFCWFSWKKAKKDISIVAKWHYITDDIHLLDYSFTIPRKEGTGSVSLAMPEGKTLPAGQYRVELTLGKITLKSLVFEIK